MAAFWWRRPVRSWPHLASRLVMAITGFSISSSTITAPMQVYVGGVNRLYQLSPELDRQVMVAPGPTNPPSSHVLYVGVTYLIGNSPYRSEVPVVSSRSLARPEMFQIAETEVTTGTRISVNSLSRDRYPIHYIYGFSSEGFSYFLTTQMRASTSNTPYISK